PVRVVGNIPYNITSPILFWLIEQRRLWTDAYLMIQKEVAERLVAGVGTKTYGRITVMVSAFLEVSICFTIPPEVFVPRPKVESAFIRLRPRTQPLIRDEYFERFERLVAATFSKRRKMLRNSLKGFQLPENIEEKIDLSRRPETLSVEEFVTLLKIPGGNVSEP
ncbi:MAG: 16S rRNA (adenine(1518)-N(6)/adenine(1519)-N(6))-dimethyltransferase, partial [FCB group bacterium]|nr:16S rRNA (adenine(1518)-N(6)/adenine(1519)-N(6))-dimethyltransferase [FCB group bacterium]